MNSVTKLAGMAEAAVVANHYATEAAIDRYRSEQSSNTLKAQDQDLHSFAAYMAQAGVAVGDLTETGSWKGVSWGVVEGFLQWMLADGLATATINRRLSTVKAYARIAMQAGAIAGDDYRAIETVRGYGRKAAKRVNARRETTRKSNKAAAPVVIPNAAVKEMSRRCQDGTAQGRRDRVMLAMLLFQGLRAGELAALGTDAIDMRSGTMSFYREKVDVEQNHNLHAETYAALLDYIQAGDCPAEGKLLRGSRKGGALTDTGMSAINITKRVGILAAAVGVDGVSAHDCRHWWATNAIRSGTDILTLQEAGGWSSLEMPRRYVAAAAIANEGIAQSIEL